MSHRVTALDGLRGLAILLVLACHLLDLKPVGGWPNLTSKALFVGVDLFFVLSGFLITGILIASRDDPHRARNFYVRRALRIFPAYYVVVLGTVIVVSLWHRDARIVADSQAMLPALLLFVQNLVSTVSPDRPMLREFAPLWSLAVEEQFYLLWPWIVWRCRTETLLRICVWLIVIAFAIKIGMVLSGSHGISIYMFTLTRMDTLAAGAFLAAWRAQHGDRPLPPWLRLMPWAALISLIAMFLYCRGIRQTQAPIITALATTATPWIFGGLLLASLKPASFTQRFFSHRGLMFFGSYSYGLYLVHFIADAGVRQWLLPPLVRATGLQGNDLAWAIAAISFLASIALAMLLYRLVEAPMLRLKQRFTAETEAVPPPLPTLAKAP